MILNCEQFRDRVKKAGAKTIYFYEGHNDLDHTNPNLRPFERLGRLDSKKDIDPKALLKELDEFAALYAGEYSAYIHTNSAKITSQGMFMRVDLRIKPDAVNTEPTGPTGPTGPGTPVNYEAVKSQLKKEIQTENELEYTKKKLKLAELVNDKNEFVAGRLALAFEKLMVSFMGQPAPMQGTPPGEDKLPPMSIDEAMIFIQQKLGDVFIIKLAGKIRHDPALAEQLKAMIP